MNAVRQANIQQPPHSIEAEQSVLGGLLLDNARWDDAVEHVGEDDFYRADHRLIWRAIAACHQNNVPVDSVTLSELLQRRGQLESAGGLAYLATLVRDTPTAENVGPYARIIREKSNARQALGIAGRLRESVTAEDDDAIDNAIKALMSLNQSQERHEYGIAEVMSKSLDSLDRLHAAEGRLVGVSSGLSDLDACLGGFQPSDLIIVGARPSLGKTALLLNFAARCGVPSGIMSAEQGHEQIGIRFIAINGHVSVHRMRTANLNDDDWKRISAGSSATAKLQIWLNDQASPTLSDVVRQARKWKHQYGIKVLYLDYLQRIRSDNPKLNFRERTADVVMGLKSLARELGIPIVALAMVNRDVDKRDDKRPFMSDLKEAGDIEQEADQILMLYRHEVYFPNDEASKGIAEINVGKNRHGPIGVIRFAWLADYMRFENLAKEAPRDAWSPPA
ncbi:MAG TPA: replicative DNA helicase [Gammaproteobacteria bacterium]|jgi:replicative DNA helicase